MYQRSIVCVRDDLIAFVIAHRFIVALLSQHPGLISAGKPGGGAFYDGITRLLLMRTKRGRFFLLVALTGYYKEGNQTSQGAWEERAQ